MSSAASRLIEEMRTGLPFYVEQACENFGRMCGSPIEVMLLGAMTLQHSLEIWAEPLEVPIQMQVASRLDGAPPSGVVVIIPQFQWQAFRIDFAFFYQSEVPRVFVECDGHQFHERTPEQAERDRSRDRQVQQAGIPIIRFTGREIVRDPFGCGTQVITFIASTLRR